MLMNKVLQGTVWINPPWPLFSFTSANPPECGKEGSKNIHRKV
jgi:hypothetical protein